ncbi:hypothetical protein FQJ90_19360 [Xanthomonas vasicola]|nr:hypothetical protein NX08_011955 [Xanthomonas vasicola]TWQ51639.1 hypothetical protein FQJ94_18100 [Xanthomonas vasicola]TWQ62170.1 hypothetical protein FQJ90_19360 [Xanthomonas vasicola]TWR04376.1 hypothetical protein FQJ85_18520 [Xanthomonas vasicola]
MRDSGSVGKRGLSCLVLHCRSLSLSLSLSLCSGLAFAVRFSSPIPQRQAAWVNPRRGGAHGCATFF